MTRETRGRAKSEQRSTRAMRALAISAFSVGVLTGGVLVIALWGIGQVASRQLEIGKPRPRRLLIGNLEIEEQGDDTRFHVE